MVIAIAVCMISAFFLDVHTGIKREDKIYGASFALIGGIFGAKLLSVLLSVKTIIEYNLSFENVIKNGFVFYGGLIGGAIGIIIYCVSFKISILRFFDTAAVILPLGSAIGRIGCLAAGCCYGRPTDSFLGVTYREPIDPTTPIGIPLLLSQLFETAYCSVLFIVLLILSRKKRRKGLLTCIYAGGYAAARFINEFFRYDAGRDFFLGLSTSQIISVLIILTIEVFFYSQKIITAYYRPVLSYFYFSFRLHSFRLHQPKEKRRKK